MRSQRAPAAGPVDLGGASARGEARAVLGRDSEIYGGGECSYRSSLYTTSDLSFYSRIASYSLENRRLGVRATDGLFDL